MKQLFTLLGKPSRPFESRSLSFCGAIPLRRPPHQYIIEIHREGNPRSTTALSALFLTFRLPVDNKEDTGIEPLPLTSCTSDIA